MSEIRSGTLVHFFFVRVSKTHERNSIYREVAYPGNVTHLDKRNVHERLQTSTERSEGIARVRLDTFAVSKSV